MANLETFRDARGQSDVEQMLRGMVHRKTESELDRPISLKYVAFLLEEITQLRRAIGHKEAYTRGLENIKAEIAGHKSDIEFLQKIKRKEIGDE